MRSILRIEPVDAAQRWSHRTDREGSVPTAGSLAPHTDADGEHSELTRRFQREVLPLMDQLGRQARRMTRNHTDAEDLVQETMMRAYAGFHSYRQETNTKAWLSRPCTRN
uniref:sigma factor n=1 Tax=Mycobacterium sp. HUMS_1102779 TaxID=3383487 RepID=UPI003899EE5E